MSRMSHKTSAVYGNSRTMRGMCQHACIDTTFDRGDLSGPFLSLIPCLLTLLAACGTELSKSFLLNGKITLVRQKLLNEEF